MSDIADRIKHEAATLWTLAKDVKSGGGSPAMLALRVRRVSADLLTVAARVSKLEAQAKRLGAYRVKKYNPPRHCGKTKYPFADMSVGDGFFEPDGSVRSKRSNLPMSPARRRKTLHAAAYNYLKRAGKTDKVWAVVRRHEEDGVLGHLVTFVAIDNLPPGISGPKKTGGKVG